MKPISIIDLFGIICLKFIQIKKHLQFQLNSKDQPENLYEKLL